MKMMLILRGMKSANSKYPCFICYNKNSSWNNVKHVKNINENDLRTFERQENILNKVN